MATSSFSFLREDSNLLNFLTGLLPPLGAGVAIAVIGGRETLVVCGSLAPYQYVGGPGGPCAQTVFVPAWGGLLLIPLGTGLGFLMARLKTLANPTRGA